MRTVYACSLRFPGTEPAKAIWKDVSAWITDWYARKAPDIKLSTEWANGGPFVPQAGHSLETLMLRVDEANAGPLREVRWHHPDDVDASLAWTANAAVHVAGDTIFTLVLKVASSEYVLSPPIIRLGTPRLVRTLVKRGDAYVGEHAISLDPQHVKPDSVGSLVSLLLSKTRRHPVVVLSSKPCGEEWSIDPNKVSNEVAGLASVYILSSRWTGFTLADEIGKRYSCYNGAVRIYWPRFSLDADPFAHRLWLPDEISKVGGSEAFAKNLLSRIAAVASFRFVEPEPIRTFRARYDDARLDILKVSNSGNYNALYEEYVRLDEEVRELREQLEAVTRHNETLRENLDAVWANYRDPSATTSTPDDEPPEPTSVYEAVGAAQRDTTYLVYLEDAFSSARDSPYERPQRVYQALIAIDEVARCWALQSQGGPPLGSRKDAFLNRGFDYSDGISQTSEGKWGREYSYQYKGKKTLFAPHITIGAKQPHKCVSIHMYWDDAERKVAIAHVGRHKTNTRS